MWKGAISPGDVAPEKTTVANQILYSEAMTPIWYVLDQAARDLNAANNSRTEFIAARLKDNAAGGTGVIMLMQQMSLILNQTYIVQCEVKADGADFYCLRQSGFGGGEGGGIGSFQYFNTLTGDIGVTAGDPGHTNFGIQPENNGYFTLWTEFTPEVADPTGNLYFYTCSDDGSIVVPLDGSQAALVNRFQCAPVSGKGVIDAPLPYVKTTSVPVTKTFGGNVVNIWKGAVNPVILQIMSEVDLVGRSRPAILDGRSIKEISGKIEGREYGTIAMTGRVRDR